MAGGFEVSDETGRLTLSLRYVCVNHVMFYLQPLVLRLL